MRIVSWVLGALGLLAVAVAIVGRYHSVPTVTVFGLVHSASTWLLAGNTLLLTAIFLLLVKPPTDGGKKSTE